MRSTWALLVLVSVFLLGYAVSHYLGDSESRKVEDATNSEVARLAEQFDDANWQVLSRFDEISANHFEREYELTFGPADYEELGSTVDSWLGDEFECAAPRYGQWVCKMRVPQSVCSGEYQITYAIATIESPAGNGRTSGISVRLFLRRCA